MATFSEQDASVEPTGEYLDIAWKWNRLKNPDDERVVTCDFCGNTTMGGIARAKRHQMGIGRDIEACKKTPHEVRVLLKEDYEEKKGKMDANVSGKSPLTSSGEASYTYDEEAAAEVAQSIENFFIEGGVPFHVVNSESFKLMLEAIGDYGPDFTPPTYHEIRGPLLKKEVQRTKELMKGHVEELTKYGCSIMYDAYTDEDNRTLINFLVNCPRGSMFVKSFNASRYMKTPEKLFELLDSFVENIGEKNVVQVITNNGSNYALAGKNYSNVVS